MPTKTFYKYYNEIQKLIFWISVRCSDRATKLLDISRDDLELIPLIPTQKAEMDEILWNELKQTLIYNPKKHGSYEEFIRSPLRPSLPNLLIFVKNLSQTFPQNPNSQRYQNCRTLEQFYQASNVEIEELL